MTPDYNTVGPLELTSADATNQQTEAAFGYPVFGYMYFLNETDSAPLIEKNVSYYQRLNTI